VNFHDRPEATIYVRKWQENRTQLVRKCSRFLLQLNCPPGLIVLITRTALISRVSVNVSEQFLNDTSAQKRLFRAIEVVIEVKMNINNQ